MTRENLAYLCKEIGDKLGLLSKNLHIAAVFENNTSDKIIGWAILDGNNKIVKKYDDLKKLWNEYDRKRSKR